MVWAQPESSGADEWSSGGYGGGGYGVISWFNSKGYEYFNLKNSKVISPSLWMGFISDITKSQSELFALFLKKSMSRNWLK